MCPRQCSLECQCKGEMYQFKRCGFCRSRFKHFGGPCDHFAPGARVEGPASQFEEEIGGNIHVRFRFLVCAPLVFLKPSLSIFPLLFI